MYTMILYILPLLGIIFVGTLCFYLLRQKVNEYNHKFSSMFTLLSAITDEITKLKMQSGGSFPSIPVEKVGDEDEDEVQQLEYIADDEESDEDYEDEDEDEEDDEEEDEEDDEEENQDEMSENKDHDEIEDLKELEEVQKKIIEERVDEVVEEIKKEDEDISSIIEEVNDPKEIEVDLNPKDYKSMTVKQLRGLAKIRGLTGDITKFKRDELILEFEKMDATV